MYINYIDAYCMLLYFICIRSTENYTFDEPNFFENCIMLLDVMHLLCIELLNNVSILNIAIFFFINH